MTEFMATTVQANSSIIRPERNRMIIKLQPNCFTDSDWNILPINTRLNDRNTKFVLAEGINFPGLTRQFNHLSAAMENTMNIS